jgi:hypothetical protein
MPIRAAISIAARGATVSILQVNLARTGMATVSVKKSLLSGGIGHAGCPAPSGKAWFLL